MPLVLSSGRQGFIPFSFLSIIAVFYYIEEDSWLKSNYFKPGRRLAVRFWYLGPI